MGIRTTRMMARALMQRWPMNERMRQGIVNRLAAVMADKQASAREVVSAAKALLAAEAQNQADEHKAIDVRVSTRHDRLDAIAADLGIEIGLIEAATREADSGTSSDAVEVDTE